MFRNSSKFLFGLVLLTSTACGGGHPVQIGVYAPYPKDDIFRVVQGKVEELGYTVERADPSKYEMVASRVLNPPVTGAEREEMAIHIAPDPTGVPKLVITTARVLRATADRPVKRVAASTKTNADANAVLQMYMQLKPPAAHQQ